MAEDATRQRLVDVVALVFLLFTAVGCTATAGWSSRSSTTLLGRTAATFATACPDVGGTLVETTNKAGRAESTCTMPNGDATTCDWHEGRCATDCRSSEQACAIVRNLAMDWASVGAATPHARHATSAGR